MVFIHSVDLLTHVFLLRKVLSIFLTNTFSRNSASASSRARNLRICDNVSPESIKPAADKIEAIRVWPEVLENETQVLQFPSSVNYCRMFVGPDYADISRHLLTLTRKATPIHWTAPHTPVVRQLRQ